MLDTKARRYVQPLIDKTSRQLIKLGVMPNFITIFACIIGVLSSILVFLNFKIISILLLWFSGYLDAVDGTMARLRNIKSNWGTLLDITFDRIVEFSIIFSLALKYSNARIELLFLTGTILFSMTIFLTVGALTKNKGKKSFYYQAGLAERTEGFIFLSLMVIMDKFEVVVTLIFALAIIITIIQRFSEAYKILN